MFHECLPQLIEGTIVIRLRKFKDSPRAISFQFQFGEYVFDFFEDKCVVEANRDSKGYHPFERMNRFSRFKSICDATKRPRFVEILLLACSRGQNMRNRRGRWSVDTRCSRCSAWSLMPVPMRDVLINVRRSDFFIATARFRCIKPVGYFILVALIHLRSRGDVPCK